MIFIFVYDVNNASAILQLILFADNTNAYMFFYLLRTQIAWLTYQTLS